MTMVIQNEKTKIAQYGQWDGYPEGNGVRILDFVRSKPRMQKLREKLKNVRFATKKDEKKVDDYLNSIGCKDGWMTQIQAEKYHKAFPYLSRNIGAGILELVSESTDKEIILVNSTDFAGDSLFCEWAYVIDLDKNVLEVYSGFNKTPLEGNERFSKIKKSKDSSEYAQIRFLKEYDLNKLPTKRIFIGELKKKEKETADVM